MRKVNGLSLVLFLALFSSLASAEDVGHKTGGSGDFPREPAVTKEELARTKTLTQQFSACMKRKYRDLEEEEKGTEYETFRGECEKCLNDSELPECKPQFPENEGAGTASGRGRRSDTISPMSGVEVNPKSRR